MKKKNALCPELSSGRQKTEQVWGMQAEEVLSDTCWQGDHRQLDCPPQGASLVAQTVKRLPAMQETQVRSLGREDLLEKEMATRSSTLAWRIPRTEEAGKLQFMGSLRVRHY